MTKWPITRMSRTNRNKTLEGRKLSAARRIARAAYGLYKQQGCKKTTVGDVAQSLSMSSSNIYRFFDDKDCLRRAVTERLLDRNYDTARRMSRRTASAVDRLKLIAIVQFTATYELFRHSPTLFELFEISIALNDDVLVWHFDRLVDLVQQVIRDGVRLGEFPQQDCHRNAVFFVLSIGTLWHPTLIATGSEPMNIKHSDLLNFSISALREGFRGSTFTGQQ